MIIRRSFSSKGFTLIEAIIVITITAIISAVIAVFIRSPVQSYFDTVRRAEMTDNVDTAARRIARDLRLALPNSVRVAGGGSVMEFLSTRTGGRYRAALPGDPLDFDSADTTFDVVGHPITFLAGDQIVIFNMGEENGTPDQNAYLGNTLNIHNRRAYNGVTGVPTISVSIASLNPFPESTNTKTMSSSPYGESYRFHVVDGPVTYICDAGILWRYWGYPIQPLKTSIDTVAKLNALAGVQKAQLMQNVSNCIFDYANGITQKLGLVSIRLSITQNAETVSLLHEVHVNNVP